VTARRNTSRKVDPSTRCADPYCGHVKRVHTGADGCRMKGCPCVMFATPYPNRIIVQRTNHREEARIVNPYT